MLVIELDFREAQVGVIMVRRALVGTVGLLFACGGSAGVGSAPKQLPEAQQPVALVIRVDSVKVATTTPSGVTWDGPEPPPSQGGCDLFSAGVGLAGSLGTGVISPVVGKAIDFLCRASEPEPRQQEQDPTNPDLQVRLSAGTGQPYTTEIVKDVTRTTFAHPFLVPLAAIPPDGLRLEVVDVDGADARDTIGAVRLSAAELVEALRSRTHLLVKQQPPSLEELELVVSGYAAPAPVTLDMPVREGTRNVDGDELRAGEVVTVTATGSYRVGQLNDALLTPVGYPGGGPRSYNFQYEPLKSANHGCGFALAGHRRRGAILVDPSGSVLSAEAGPVVVGVNDAEPGNNTGDVTFTVQRRSPTAEEWSRQRAAGDSAKPIKPDTIAR